MDFKLQMGRLLAIFGVHLSNLFLCGLLLLCVLSWVVSCLGWCGCWAFLCVVISVCTELLYFGGEFEQLVVINCFWKIWAALKRDHPDWLATEEDAAVETVLWW